MADYLMHDCSLLHSLEQDQSKCLIYGIAGYLLLRRCEYILKSMEIQFGHSELSVISQVSVMYLAVQDSKI